MSYLDDLKNVIRKLHGADATHRESVPVKETWRGQTVWEGIVEVFTLHDHPQTDTVYAWSHETDEGPKRHVTVLHIHPALSPLAAVRAAIMQEYHASQATA